MSPALRPVLALLAMLAPWTAGACTTGAAGSSREVAAVASVYPLAWLAEQVAPDAEVTSLASGGQDAHDLELTPTERALVERADVVLYLGNIGFQPHIEEAVDTRSRGVVSVVGAIDPEMLLTLEAHQGHQDEGGVEHSTAGPAKAVDPHVWFDAGLMADVTEHIGEAFAAADPRNANAYAANAARVAAELRALDDEIGELLSGCAIDTVVVSHEAYAYLLRPHGLTQEGISPAGGHSDPSPRDIARLAAEVRMLGIRTVLTEPVEGRSGAEAVAREAGVRTDGIYSLDIVNERHADTGYPELLRQQAQVVAGAADCGAQ